MGTRTLLVWLLVGVLGWLTGLGVFLVVEAIR